MVALIPVGIFGEGSLSPDSLEVSLRYCVAARVFQNTRPFGRGAPSFIGTRASDRPGFRPWFVFAQLAERGLKAYGEFVRWAFAPVM